MTTTPAAVLAKLQAAWQAAAAAAEKADVEAEPAVVAYCGPHNDPTQWVFKPDRYDRQGWQTAYCQRCGRFIGHQPPPKKRRQPTSTERNKP